MPVDFVGLDGQERPLEDESADAVLCTWTLCSIPDPISAVREIKRILRPNGRFHFIEHGKSPDAKVLVWQNRLNGIQQKVACGCNLNRDIPAIVEAGGLAPTQLKSSTPRAKPSCSAGRSRVRRPGAGSRTSRPPSR